MDEAGVFAAMIDWGYTRAAVALWQDMLDQVLACHILAEADPGHQQMRVNESAFRGEMAGMYRDVSERAKSGGDKLGEDGTNALEILEGVERATIELIDHHQNNVKENWAARYKLLVMELWGDHDGKRFHSAVDQYREVLPPWFLEQLDGLDDDPEESDEDWKQGRSESDD